MRRFLGIAGAGLVAAAGIVALAGFRGGCGGHGHGPGGHDPEQIAAFVTNRVDDALDDLDATPDQRVRIHAVKDRMLAAAAKAHDGRRADHDVILAEWKADSPDRAKLHALVDERVEAMRALAHEAVDAGVEVHGILTPEQRAKLARKAERWHR